MVLPGGGFKWKWNRRHREGINEGNSQCNASRGIMASPEHPKEVCVADDLRIILDPDTLRVVAHPGWSSVRSTMAHL